MFTASTARCTRRPEHERHFSDLCANAARRPKRPRPLVAASAPCRPLPSDSYRMTLVGDRATPWPRGRHLMTSSWATTVPGRVAAERPTGVRRRPTCAWATPGRLPLRRAREVSTLRPLTLLGGAACRGVGIANLDPFARRCPGRSDDVQCPSSPHGARRHGRPAGRPSRSERSTCCWCVPTGCLAPCSDESHD